MISSDGVDGMLPRYGRHSNLEPPPRAETASLAPFFNARSVAVIGASRDPSGVGHRVVRGLLDAGYTGRVMPVNPAAATIAGLPAYASVDALPEAPALAVVAVPAAAVEQVVAACADRGVRAVVVLSAGYAETGAEGRARQERLAQQVRQAGMRLVGPNSLGILCTDPSLRLNASFSPVFPPEGSVALASESGAVGLAVLQLAKARHLGVSAFVSLGNRADVSSNDLLEWWAEDPRTSVVLLYLESFGNPRRFADVARRVARRKPIVALKSGRSAAGQRAAGSHTAALAAPDIAVDALFAQTGVLRAGTIDELFGLGALLGSQPLPRGRRVALLTNAGGPGILCADACQASGLAVVELAAETRDALAALLPAAASVANPVDTLAAVAPEAYRRCVEVLLAAPEVDALITLFVPVGITPAEDIGAAIVDGVAAGRAAGHAQPVLACLMGGQTPARETPLDGQGERIPVYPFPEHAVGALAAAARHAEWCSQPPGQVPAFADVHAESARERCRTAGDGTGGWLSAAEVRAVLADFGLPITAGGVARTADEAVALADGIGYPVALKAASRRIVHKTEVGGVRLGLADGADVRTAFEAMRASVGAVDAAAADDGVLVQPMLRGGVEVMAGVTTDPLFGPLIAFGLGGIHVEILGDVAFRVAPLSDVDAGEIIRAIRGHRLLLGYRGHPAADIAALEDLVLRLSALAVAVPEIAEIDLNPVFALANGCMIADARIRVVPVGPAVARPGIRAGVMLTPTARKDPDHG